MTYRILIIFFTLINCIPSVAPAQWVKINSYTAFGTKDIEYEGGIFYAGATNGVWKSTDAGQSWQNISTGLSGDELMTYDIFFDGESIYIATVEGNFKTTNGGANWEPKSNGITIGPQATKRYCFSLFRDGSILFSGAFSGLYKSTDEGDNWTLSGIPGPHSFVESMFKYNGAIYAGRTSSVNATLYKSTDVGISWTPISFFSQFTPEVFCFHETPDNKLFIGTGHGVYFTTNNGTNWTQRNNGLSSDPYNTSIVQRGNTIFTSTTFGGNNVYRTSDEGLNWESVNQGLPFISDINKLLIAGDTLYLAGTSGIYKRPLSEILTGITQTSSGIPDKFKLYQNYPNPFNPSTTISFDIPKAGFVSLKVFDIKGREVSELINKNLQPGSYSAIFHAEDLTSGIYFYKLITGEYISTRKMVLLK